MNWRSRYRERDKQAAAQIPPGKFDGLLDPSEDSPSGHFLIGNEEQGYHFWCGIMSVAYTRPVRTISLTISPW